MYLISEISDAEIVIGFINPPYVANERDGVSFLRFGVITGNLQREISVELSLSNGSAIRKSARKKRVKFENIGRSLCILSNCHHGTKFIPLANNTNYFYANIKRWCEY